MNNFPEFVKKVHAINDEWFKSDPKKSKYLSRMKAVANAGGIEVISTQISIDFIVCLYSFYELDLDPIKETEKCLDKLQKNNQPKQK
jgi:hypothetical protein